MLQSPPPPPRMAQSTVANPAMLADEDSELDSPSFIHEKWVGSESDTEEDEENDHGGMNDDDDDDGDDDDDEEVSWITWFCSLPGHEFFCEVHEEFIEDEFNLTGLSGMVHYYREALEMILDIEPEDESAAEAEAPAIEAAAVILYGLIHQRFILTRQGIHLMMQRYNRGFFGECPRVYCLQTPMLPCGQSDTPGVATLRLYCPSCRDLYEPAHRRHQALDGASFGTTFAHLFFAMDSGFTWPGKAHSEVYRPRVFGFAVNERSVAGPHMTWLRRWPTGDENGDGDDDDTATLDESGTVEEDDEVLIQQQQQNPTTFAVNSHTVGSAIQISKLRT